MSEWIKAAWMLITGYPMRRLERCRFVDKVSGKSVGLYEDKYGRTFLAEGEWAMFRVPSKAPDTHKVNG